jgi:OFA family oxalate/formate antiporter-like MFS transporter
MDDGPGFVCKNTIGKNTYFKRTVMKIRIPVKNRYLLLAMGMVIQLCAGIIYMWSVFKGPVSEHFSWDPASAAITSSIMLATFVLGIIIGGLLQDKYTPTPVALAGSILLGVGMFLSAFVPQSSPWLIYIFYGVIGGFGVGCVYTSTVSVVQKWFPDRRGFATGMMVSAFGFSLVLFAPLTKFLLANWGVPKTFTFFGVLFFIVCSFCSLFLSNPETKSAGGAVPVSAQKQYKTSEMLKTKEFYLLAFSMFFLLPAYFILNPLFISLGVERGLTENMAAVGVMLTGIASASGRLLASWFSDYAGRKAAIATITLITLVAAIAMVFARGPAFLICIAAIAFSFGGSASVYAATAADLFGTKHIGLNYGCVMVGFGVSALVFPVISNAFAAGGVESYSFIVAAAACLISLILTGLLKIPQKSK